MKGKESAERNMRDGDFLIYFKVLYRKILDVR